MERGAAAPLLLLALDERRHDPAERREARVDRRRLAQVGAARAAAAERAGRRPLAAGEVDEPQAADDDAPRGGAAVAATTLTAAAALPQHVLVAGPVPCCGVCAPTAAAAVGIAITAGRRRRGAALDALERDGEDRVAAARAVVEARRAGLARRLAAPQQPREVGRARGLDDGEPLDVRATAAIAAIAAAAALLRVAAADLLCKEWMAPEGGNKFSIETHFALQQLAHATLLVLTAAHLEALVGCGCQAAAGR